MEVSFLRGGLCIPTATVEYVCYPGNSYDRHYAKFCRHYGDWQDDVSVEERLRLALGEVSAQNDLERLRAAGVGCPDALLPD